LFCRGEILEHYGVSIDDDFNVFLTKSARQAVIDYFNLRLKYNRPVSAIEIKRITVSRYDKDSDSVEIINDDWASLYIDYIAIPI